MREDEPECTCDEGCGEHPCPYQCDINGNDESYCSCCEFCERQCAMDI
jgi:hypothetical protein